MTLAESLALDISAKAHRAVDEFKTGNTEKALNYLDEVKALHQQLHYEVWMNYHTSGTVK